MASGGVSGPRADQDSPFCGVPPLPAQPIPPLWAGRALGLHVWVCGCTAMELSPPASMQDTGIPFATIHCPYLPVALWTLALVALLCSNSAGTDEGSAMCWTSSGADGLKRSPSVLLEPRTGQQMVHDLTQPPVSFCLLSSQKSIALGKIQELDSKKFLLVQ